MPIIPATVESEAEGSQVQGLPGSRMSSVYTGNLVKSCLERKKEEGRKEERREGGREERREERRRRERKRRKNGHSSGVGFQPRMCEVQGSKPSCVIKF